MIHGKLVKIIEKLHSDINELYYDVDSVKINEQSLIRCLGSVLNYNTKQLTKIVNNQQHQIKTLLSIINAYIDFKGDGNEFAQAVKEKHGKPKETLEQN